MVNTRKVGPLLSDAEDLELLREQMQSMLSELRSDLAQDWEVRRAILQNGPCNAFVRSLTKDLRAAGYSGRLDTVSDCMQAVQFYEGSRVFDLVGLFLADALLVAKIFTDPHWGDFSEEQLWRFSYRLATLFALGKAEAARAELAARRQAESDLEELENRSREAKSRGGRESAIARRLENADRDNAICDEGRRLLAAGFSERDLAGIIANQATGCGLSQKRIGQILVAGGVKRK